MPRLLITLIIAFSCSCTNATAADAEYSNKEVTMATVANSEIKHTKHVQRQQKDICKRLKRIQKKLERRKKNKKG